MAASPDDPGRLPFAWREEDYHARQREKIQPGLFDQGRAASLTAGHEQVATNLQAPPSGAQNLFIGYDEAGRGCWAGPLAVAAVVFFSRDLTAIQERRLLPELTDSKDMAPATRLIYERQIRGIARAWSLVLVPARRLDRLGLARAIEFAFARAGRDVLKKISPARPAGSVPDGKMGEDPLVHFIDGNYRFRGQTWEQRQARAAGVYSVVRGDSRLACIAAASVLAKSGRDRWMRGAARRFPEYGFDRHKGYGTAAHRNALARWGPCPLHRRSFRPVARLS